MSSAAQAFEQRSAAAVAQVVAELDNACFAPVTVSPLPSSLPSVDAGGLDFRAAQVAADSRLAEEMQREEYRKEEVRTERRQQRLAAAAAEQNASWTEWLTGTTPTSHVASTNASSVSAAASSAARPASSSAVGGRGGGGARVAQPSSSMFACVAQSISSVMGPPQGHVSGVDSTSLI